jgi:hypothetical protein
MNHLTPDEVEAFVVCGDPLPDAARRHLAGCAACARVVQREARLELEIYDAVAEVAEARPPGAVDGKAPMAAGATEGTPVWRHALTAASVLMLGVVGLLVMRRDRPPPPHMTAVSMNSLRGTMIAPRPVGARWPPDTPCLRDPRTYMPGFDVVPPEPPGMRATMPAMKP